MIDIDKFKEAYESSEYSFKHGLTISTRPKQDIEFVKGSFIVTGITESEESDVFKDLVNEEWFVNEDKLGFGTVAFAEKHFLHIKNTSTITIQCNGAHFIIILAESNANILINSTGSTRVHILTKNQAKVSVTHSLYGSAISHKYAHIKSGSVDFTDIAITSEYIRSYVGNLLKGKDGSGTIKSFYLTKEKGIVDLYTESYHAASHTYSDIVTRGVLLDKSKALSRGLVSIGKNAPYSEGYEQQDALLLSDVAEADAIPNLEIHNNEVKCSHGSTVGKIDEEKLFYLRSRGLSKEAAQNILVEGYFLPVIDAISDENIKVQLLRTLQEAIDGNNN